MTYKFHVLAVSKKRMEISDITRSFCRILSRRIFLRVSKLGLQVSGLKCFERYVCLMIAFLIIRESAAERVHQVLMESNVK